MTTDDDSAVSSDKNEAAPPPVASTVRAAPPVLLSSRAASRGMVSGAARLARAIIIVVAGLLMLRLAVPATERTPSADESKVTGFSSASGSWIRIDGAKYGVQNGNKGWSLSNPDSYTLRFEVRSGDQWKYDTDWKERSEVFRDSVIPHGHVVSISYQFMVEPGDDNQATGALGTGNWLTLGQFHSDDGTSSSVFAVELIGEKLAIRASYKLPGEDFTSWYAFTDTADIVRGKYYDIKIEANFSNNNTGFLKVWRDGSQIVGYDGPIGYGAGVYWKYGIYRREQDEPIAVNYRNMSGPQTHG